MPPKKKDVKADASSNKASEEVPELSEEEKKAQEAAALRSKKAKEEAAAREAVEEAQKKANIAVVNFKPAHPESIISRHTGSILANEEPVIALSSTQLEKVMKIFTAKATLLPTESVDGIEYPKTLLSVNILPEVLVEYGIDSPKAELIKVLANMKVVSDLDEKSFISFIERFHAPAFHYGQRLRLYSSRGEVEKMIELIIRGCNPNTSDGFGLSPLHYASEFNKIESIQALSDLSTTYKPQFSLSINANDKNNWTPLHCAAHHGSLDSVALLIQLGASVSPSTNQGKTPLHLAAARGYMRICELLSKAGASASAKDVHGMTPLHDATFNGQEKTYAMLTALPDADQSIVDKLKKKASDYLGVALFSDMRLDRTTKK